MVGNSVQGDLLWSLLRNMYLSQRISPDFENNYFNILRHKLGWWGWTMSGMFFLWENKSQFGKKNAEC